MYLKVSIVECWRLNIQKCMERFRYLRNIFAKNVTPLELNCNEIWKHWCGRCIFTLLYIDAVIYADTQICKKICYLCYAQMNFTHWHNTDICIFIQISFNVGTRTWYVLLLLQYLFNFWNKNQLSERLNSQYEILFSWWIFDTL